MCIQGGVCSGLRQKHEGENPLHLLTAFKGAVKSPESSQRCTVKGSGYKLQLRETPAGCKEKYSSSGYWRAQSGCEDSSVGNIQT